MRHYLWLLLPFLPLAGAEHRLDINSSAGTPNFDHHATVEMDSRLMFGAADARFIINPRIKSHANTVIASGLGIGVRGWHEETLVGFFLYAEHTKVKGKDLLQIGPSWEILGKRIDIRLNAYFPINDTVKTSKTIIQVHHRLDGELCWKTSRIHFGVSPSYDFETQRIALAGRLGIPIKSNTVDITFGKDVTFGTFGKVAFTIASFGSKASYSQKIRRSSGSFYEVIPLPKPIKAAAPEPIKKVPEPIPTPIPPATKPPETKPRGWIDYFFRRR